MKILVTGGAGFIGSNFIHYWLNKHPSDYILNLDKLTYAGNLQNLKSLEKNKHYSFLKGDIVNKEDVEKVFKFEIDILVHFAAESHVDRSIEDPLEFVRTNVLGTANLLEAAKRHGISKVVHISTDEVYGHLPLRGKDKFTENSSYAPRSPYSASKAASDHLAKAYYETYNIPIVVTNCSNNVGPYQHPEKFIPKAITNILEGKPIYVYGTGDNKRDWLWVEDHCEGIELVAKKGKPGETYLFGGVSGAKYSNLQVAKLILQKMKKPVYIAKEGEVTQNEPTIILIKDRLGHDLRYDVEWKKSAKELSWRPRYGLEEILDKTIDWYTQNEWWWKPLKNLS